MTPEDLPFDPGLFLDSQSLTLYRLARARYANLSGVGAALVPGRWNRLGQEAIYTSTEQGVPLLERLVHTPKHLIPSNLALMKIRISGKWEGHKNAVLDPKTGGCLAFYRTISEARRSFEHDPHFFGVGINPFGIAVPSVIVPVWNVVLYPQGVGFWDHVALDSVEPFEFDPRLFPDSAAIDTTY